MSLRPIGTMPEWMRNVNRRLTLLERRRRVHADTDEAVAQVAADRLTQLEDRVAALEQQLSDRQG